MNAKSQIALAVAAVVAAALDKKNASAKAGEVGKSAVAALREYAAVTAQHGVEPKDAVELLNASWKATGKAAGTIKPYLSSFKGYRQAIVEGVDIFNADPEADEAKPMTAPAARVFLLNKDEREEKAALDKVRAELAKRARACTNLSDLQTLVDMLPEVKGKVAAVKELTADDILASLNLSDDDSETVEDDVQEAVSA